MEFRNPGGLTSPFDYRDAYAARAAIPAVVSEAPVSVDLHNIPVLMQGQRPACVAHAAAKLLMWYWYCRTGKLIRFSPRFIDAYMKTFDGLNLENDGAYPRYSMKVLAKVGCATEDTLPNDIFLSDTEYRDPSILTPAVMAEAARYKIPGYVSIKTDINSSRRGMREFGPLSMLLEIGEEFFTGPDGVSSWDPNKIMPLRTPHPSIGRHQVTRHSSFNPDLDKLANSWSANWGYEGDGSFHPSEWYPYINEQWAIASIPEDVTAFIATLPAPSEFHYNFTRDLHYGAPRDEEVKYAQIAFMILGFLDALPADQLGFYGNKTAAAVVKYQQARKIIAPSAHDIGPRTRAALNADFAV
jgi:hypothetical protein